MVQAASCSLTFLLFTNFMPQQLIFACIRINCGCGNYARYLSSIYYLKDVKNNLTVNRPKESRDGEVRKFITQLNKFFAARSMADVITLVGSRRS